MFAEARVALGAVQWPNGVDLAPDAMYEAIRESGVYGTWISMRHKCLQRLRQQRSLPQPN